MNYHCGLSESDQNLKSVLHNEKKSLKLSPKEFPDRQWNELTIQDLLRKRHATGTVCATLEP